ncbi:MAG: PLP-dependent aminotransferase family protein [Thermoanaerobaculaceae bacterium]|nr:PLP-dependent aminotransferase family protein [Thermoanaerobaculaceae bacterium]TAM44663.1 MAG: PLP-dependent aminotransferase family protein [Acidobacteriota bacterium]
MDQILDRARRAVSASASHPLYLRLAEALAPTLAEDGAGTLPSARALAVEIGLNRATVTAAYRELARRGLLALRPGRPGRRPAAHAEPAPAGFEPPAGGIDLARYAPDRELLPAGQVFRWLGVGEGEGEGVAQYGSAWGYQPLRGWLAARLASFGVPAAADRVLLTGGVQHALDLLLRALARPGDTVLVEDPTYPGLPPLLALHQVRVVGIPVHRDGVRPAEVAALLRQERPLLAILTPTLHNPSGLVLGEENRRELLRLLRGRGVQVVEELFDPALVSDGEVPPPLAALDPAVVAVGSFSKALFPGLRVGWVAGPAELLERVAAVKSSADLGGSPFLEAAAWTLCRRGVFDDQLARLRGAARARLEIVLAALAHAPKGVAWSVPRGGFSLLVTLPPGWSSRAVAARAGERGVWVLPGPAMSVSGRDDVVRLAYAAVGGERLEEGMRGFCAALEPGRGPLPLV